jgi:hypothetical protein
MRKTLATAAMIVLAFAPVAQAEKATATANASYQGMWGSFGSAGRYDLYAGLHEINGKVAVCGMIYYSDDANNTTRLLEKKRSKYVRYLVDGKPLVIHAADFLRYNSEKEALQSQKTGCTVTRKAWSTVKDPKSFKLGLPPGGTFVY